MDAVPSRLPDRQNKLCKSAHLHTIHRSILAKWSCRQQVGVLCIYSIYPYLPYLPKYVKHVSSAHLLDSTSAFRLLTTELDYRWPHDANLAATKTFQNKWTGTVAEGREEAATSGTGSACPLQGDLRLAMRSGKLSGLCLAQAQEGQFKTQQFKTLTAAFLGGIQKLDPFSPEMSIALKTLHSHASNGLTWYDLLHIILQ